MIARIAVLGAVATSAALLHTSLETVVTDTILGVTVAVAVFVLYYVFVLRRAGSGRCGNP
jgi:hypothetical protein